MSEVLYTIAFCIVSIWLLTLVLQPRFPLTFKARVVYVCDGDTVFVKRGFSKIRLRLAGIDAPESEQDFGRESQKKLANLIGGKKVRVRALDIDIYGRYVAQIFCDDRDVGLQMLESGLAWPYFRFFSLLSVQDQNLYRQAAGHARSSSLGLWHVPRPIAPWHWRRQHRTMLQRLCIWIRRVLRWLAGRGF